MTCELWYFCPFRCCSHPRHSDIERMVLTFAPFVNSTQFVCPLRVKQGFSFHHISVSEIACGTLELWFHFQQMILIDSLPLPLTNLCDSRLLVDSV